MGPWAHPRSRGENCTYAINASTDAGSSPLTRGKHRQRGRLLDRNRLIPAHAGKTSKLEGTDVNFEAHPRSRGENGLTSAGTAVKAGSSPLTRGKHAIPAASATPMRLIPAHAGKTCRSGSGWQRARAHPRSRGENPFPSTKCAGSLGSSPLTRGKPSAVSVRAPLERLIPAHAGKTTCSAAPSATRRAHPRSRGENEGRK